MSFLVAKILRATNRDSLRWLARLMIVAVYKVKGTRAEVKYLPQFNLWQYKIHNHYYLTSEPSWFSSEQYYLDTLKYYSANQYWPSPGDVVIDVGAGVGEETLTFSKLVGDQGKVYSIEANPGTFAVLQFFCRQNNLPNVVLNNVALGEKQGVTFIEDEQMYGVGNTLSASAIGASVEVQMTSLDKFVTDHKLSKIDLLKMNIEGAEQLVIGGMMESINQVKNVAISCHDFRADLGEGEFYRTREKIVAFLGRHNFEIVTRSSGDAVADNYVYGTNRKLMS